MRVQNGDLYAWPPSCPEVGICPLTGWASCGERTGRPTSHCNSSTLEILKFKLSSHSCSQPGRGGKRAQSQREVWVGWEGAVSQTPGKQWEARVPLLPEEEEAASREWRSTGSPEHKGTDLRQRKVPPAPWPQGHVLE